MFRLDPERAHGLSLSALRAAAGSRLSLRLLRALFPAPTDACLQTTAFGLRFANPVGLAAGYDKSGVAVAGLAALGFGHIEIGTVTRLPQPGNPKPRLHRVVEREGVINALGFPNDGVEVLSEKCSVLSLQHSAPSTQHSLLGVNLGKGKDTPLERAADDYCALLARVASFAGYVTVNISSPNTPELRKLQTRAFIAQLLGAVTTARNAVIPREGAAQRHLPVLVKIAPDLTDTELDDVLDAVAETGTDGIIATNTTISREGIPAHYADLKGGLSGAPLRAKSTEMVRKIHTRSAGRIPIIGVGGVDGPEAALEKIRAGAALVQVYTGLVYRGPGLANAINRGIAAECTRLGVKSVGELVGAASR